ncbi:MAG TPA: SDR family oxidoreductase [Chloroflexota bacterium]|jgi:NAD(P)-dependent dehydrogenase (short-subunit alcohol dehydrogenase family)
MSLEKFDLTGKVALVTGAAVGLGHAMALGLAGAGADVAVSDINAEGVQATRREIEGLGRRGIAVTCDNSKRENIMALFAEVDRVFGRIDILINNVGAGARYRPEELPFEDWQRVINISLTGTFICAIEAGKRMIAQGSGGSIINIGSTCGMSGMGRGNLPHGAAKAGVNQLTRDLAVEWGPHRIRVNSIQPAQIATDAWVAGMTSLPWDYPAFEQHLLNGIPLGRLGKDDDLVGPAIFLASDAAAFVTGHLLFVDGGNLALNAAGSITWPALKEDR